MLKLNHGPARRIAGLALAGVIAAAGMATAGAAQSDQKDQEVFEKRIVIRHAGDKGDLKPGEVPKVDELTKKIQSESDKGKRDAMIKEAFTIHMDDVGHLPLHQQSLAWGVSKKVELTQLADNFMYFKWMSIKP